MKSSLHYDESDWKQPLPEKIPPPSYAPAALALALVLLLWGIVTSPVLSLAGVGLFVFAAVAWIKELFRE